MLKSPSAIGAAMVGKVNYDDRQFAVYARGRAMSPAVRYLAGRTEAIPLRADSCDVVLMCLVIHHVADLAAGVGEISRVLRPDGRVLIRNTFADRMRDHWWYQFWPRAAEIEREMFPTTGEVAAAFSGTGLEVRALEAVPEPLAGPGRLIVGLGGAARLA